MKHLTYLLLVFLALSCESPSGQCVRVEGDLMKWHEVALVLNGPETSETDEENPFLDYRVEIFFSKGQRTFRVPGYYATDGNAGESSADEG